MWDSGEGLLAQEPGTGTCYTSWDRKVAAGTVTGRVFGETVPFHELQVEGHLERVGCPGGLLEPHQMG